MDSRQDTKIQTATNFHHYDYNPYLKWQKLLAFEIKYCLFSVHTNLEILFQIENKIIHDFTSAFIGKSVHTYHIIKCTCFSVKFGLQCCLALDLLRLSNFRFVL